MRGEARGPGGRWWAGATLLSLLSLPSLLSLLLLPLPVQTATAAEPPRPTLHERPPTPLGTRRDRVVGKAAPGGLPGAIDTSAGRIDAPPIRGVGETDGDGAPLYPAPPEPGTTPPPTIRPDASTGKEGALHYRVVFDPSVAPFKRDLAFDRASPEGNLEMSGEGSVTITPGGGGARPGRELFWGHVTLELVAGRRTPLPSVAPDSTILGMQADPPLPLALERDAAGNFSVGLGATRGAKAAGAQRVELRYLMDAPSTYFAAPLDDGPSADDPPQPSLDGALATRLRALWPDVGVGADRSRRANVEALTAYFRAFVPGPGPRPGPALVTELIRSRRGICRHRAHGFVLMAWSLGIPAHYVMNDAHAFVEVWVRGQSGRGQWLRVDLGGGAESLELHGADDHHLHRPLFRDSLPRPASYLAEGSPRGPAGEGDGAGSWAGAQKLIGADAFRSPPAATNPYAGNGPGFAGPGPGASKDDAWLRARAVALAAPSRPPGSPSGPKPTSTDGDGRAATQLVLEPVASVAYVGEVFEIRGALRADAPRQLSGLPLEVWLVDPRNRDTGLRIGHAITGKDGAFTAKVAMPLDARLGDWDLVVRFAGDRGLRPTFSVDR